MDTEEDMEQEEPKAVEVPLPNVSTNALRKIVEFCELQLEEPMKELERPLKSDKMADIVQAPFAKFVEMDLDLLFEVVLAANYMDMKPLLDLTCASVAAMMKDKSVEDIRKAFNVTADFTPEEEERIKKDNKWLEEA